MRRRKSSRRRAIAYLGLGEFTDGAGVAVGQFPQHLPAGKVAKHKNELRLVRQRGRGGGFWGFGAGIHVRNLKNRRTKRKCGCASQQRGCANQQIVRAVLNVSCADW